MVSESEDPRISVPPRREPTALPNGTWKQWWEVTSEARFDLSKLSVPSMTSFAFLHLAVVVIPTESGLRVEVVSDEPNSPDEITYCSIFLQRLAACSEASIAIDGVVNHPILKLSQNPPDFQG